MTTQAQSADPLDFDPEALRRKYREERDRRLRPDGNRQHVEIAGEFSRYIDRPARVGARYYSECTPGYYNNEGKVNETGGFLSGQYGRGPVEFFQILHDWRAEGQLRGLDIRRNQAS